MKVFSESATSPRNLQTPVDLAHLKTLLSKDMTSLLPSGRFQMWQTFLMLFDMLFCLRTIEVDRMFKNPEKSLPKDERQMSQTVRTGSYIRVLDQILEVLEQRVVAQKDLAAIVCGGSMEQVCSACKLQQRHHGRSDLHVRSKDCSCCDVPIGAKEHLQLWSKDL